MVKITFPMMAATLVLGAAAAAAEPVDCSGFPDFPARMNCYDVTSRAPRDTATQSRPDVTPTRQTAQKISKPHPL
jgi:hypothetical protein